MACINDTQHAVLDTLAALDVVAGFFRDPLTVAALSSLSEVPGGIRACALLLATSQEIEYQIVVPVSDYEEVADTELVSPVAKIGLIRRQYLEDLALANDAATDFLDDLGFSLAGVSQTEGAIGQIIVVLDHLAKQEDAAAAPNPAEDVDTAVPGDIFEEDATQ